ncbi:hypothetical protein Dimus_008360, partial [Dionaea muscipula]
MAKLPYYVPYEYVAFAKPDNFTIAGSYGELISQFQFQKYDAVVGDVTILANRSKYMDFTQPYTESGVTMVVPVKDAKINKAWIFLKPLTWDLWIGTSLYYSFSMMVLLKEKHPEQLIQICCGGLDSYTASLTSMLTVQQLQPTITDVNILIRNQEYVGFQGGSFVKVVLLQLGFHETRLRSYSKLEQLDELLTNGSVNGGIAAELDEIPYMKFFLAKYCSKYVMVQPTYKTGGFGFVFHLGSPLVPDVSRAILNVTEGNDMVRIEKKWIAQQDSCLDSSSIATTMSSLGSDSFWGLFLVVGTVSVLAICIFVGMFLHEQRHIWMRGDAPFWTKFQVLARILNQRDTKFHTCRKAQLQQSANGSTLSVQTYGAGAIDTAPNTDSPPSPSNYTAGNTPLVLIDGANVVDAAPSTGPASYAGTDLEVLIAMWMLEGSLRGLMREENYRSFSLAIILRYLGGAGAASCCLPASLVAALSKGLLGIK